MSKAKRKPKPISEMTLDEMIAEMGKSFFAVAKLWHPRFKTDRKAFFCNGKSSNTPRGAVSKALLAVRKERAKK